MEINAPESVRQLLARTARMVEERPFVTHRILKGGHAQTLGAYAWPRKYRFQNPQDEERFFDVAPGTKVLAHCRLQESPREHATVVIWHGIEGSSSSIYMIAMADKAFRAGFNVFRMNVRTCGGTEHLTSSIYHGGLTDDLREVVRQLIEDDQLRPLLLVGFSLGGNMVLKLAGEYGDKAPAEVVAVSAVSPSIDLDASAQMIHKRSNWIYHQNFVDRLKKRVRAKHKLFPSLYDISGLDDVKTLREFDDRFTAPAGGFKGVDDYYHRASSIRVIDQIRIPTLIIHAQDDPFIPHAPLRDPVVTNNPYILLIDPERGGHVAFVSNTANGEDRFWSENRVVDFCRLAVEN